jgi:hypothetical protein
LDVLITVTNAVNGLDLWKFEQIPGVIFSIIWPKVVKRLSVLVRKHPTPYANLVVAGVGGGVFHPMRSAEPGVGIVEVCQVERRNKVPLFCSEIS